MMVQDQIALFYWMRLWSGVGFATGLVLYVVSFFIKGKEPEAAAA